MKKLLLTALLLPAAHLFSESEVTPDAQEEESVVVSQEQHPEEVEVSRGTQRSGGHWHAFFENWLKDNGENAVEAALNQLATSLAQSPNKAIPSKARAMRMYQRSCEVNNKTCDLSWFEGLYERLVTLLSTYLNNLTGSAEVVVAPEDATDAQLELTECDYTVQQEVSSQQE